MAKYYWGFWYALALLSRIPTPFIKRTDAPVASASLWFYPIVGGVLGALLLVAVAGLLCIKADAANLLLAAILLALWVWFSGAMHIDGLADCADAWVGGLGDRERTLAIMKDPRSGPMAIAVVMVVLLLKFAALYALLSAAKFDAGINWPLLMVGLMLVPMLARSSLLVIMKCLPYAREQGMVSQFKNGLPLWALLLIVSALSALVILSMPSAWPLLLAFGLFCVLAYRVLKQRLGGYTGDTLGAIVELQEVLLLSVLAFL